MILLVGAIGAFRPIRLMFNLTALSGYAPIKNLPDGSCRKMATKRHKDPPCQHLTQHDQE